MIRLFTFDGADLVGSDGQSISSALEQPKRLALLTYLALAGPGTFRSRDTIIGLFWPDSDQERARGSLNQSLHMLRRLLGTGVIVNRGAADVSVAPDVFWCDAVAFNQSLERGDREAALHLYKGALLPGLFIDAAPEFEEWLEGERASFRRKACAAAWSLAEAAEARCQASIAMEWCRRCAELSPDDETILRQQVQLMDRLGNRSGAIHVYERFAARLAKEYDVEPSVESQNLIERVRSRAAPHARLVNAREDATPAAAAAVSARARPYLGATADQDSVVPIPSPSPDLPLCLGSAGSPSGARRSLRWRLTAVVFPISLAIWTVIHFTQASTRHTQAPQRTRIMVGSFTDTMAPLESVALGQFLTAGIVARLAEVPAFDIVQQGTLRQGEIAQPSLSPEPQFLVTGNVLRSGEQVLVDAQIIDVQSGRTIGTATAEQDSGSAVSMVDQISQHLALMVRTVAGREVQLREWSATTKSIAARDLLGSAMADRDRARRLQRPPTMRAAIKALQDADSLLAEVEVLVPREKEPIIERARVLEQLGIFLWAPSIHDSVAVKIALRRAVTEARRALSMDTTDASALEALGSASYWYWLTIPLAPDSARRVLTNAEQSLRRAVEIDPDRASAWNLLSTALYLRADFAGAYLAADKAYAADAYLENARGILGMLFITSYEIGDDSASDHWCNEMNRLFTHTWSSAWCRLSLLAWNESHGAVAIAQAWRIATEEEREPATPRRARAALQILVAAVLARSDLRDSAEAVLLRARQEGGPDSELLPVEATARIAMNEPDSAIQLLARYVGEAPAHRMGILRSRRFVSLGALDRHIMHATDCATCRKTAKEQRVPPQ